ncbi:MAG TPA: hypothetical protein DEB17_00390 [Chlorobaculum sp.]|uniref:Uncharacterized protein n=1 Tax=Chlorobaculum tepidum (strain ATCC 49652 / DSM 12025 / NBRC 103806 / TLS) TaxID=194439 RepID=Q8KC22_CHLTE|nr:hypothetical protein CT1604 [Chlorobaculum tepidum TLS]HBU22457.1 hypothetical protein [Chlorobaculum sp.]
MSANGLSGRCGRTAFTQAIKPVPLYRPRSNELLAAFKKAKTDYLRRKILYRFFHSISSVLWITRLKYG